jgi:hypothetical protein
MPTVILSDGQACKVRRLGLFELDNVGREVLGVYRYSLLLATGQIVEDSYDIRALTYTPTAPDKPANEIEQGSAEWFQLQEFDTYTAALAHEKLRIESYEGYASDVATYITNNCLSPDDRNRIVEPEDWDLIYIAATVPQLTMEGVANTLKYTFPGLIWEYGSVGRADAIGEGEGSILGDSTMGVGDD